MNINATLFGQMIGFALFVWLTMKYIWPPLKAAMDERQKTNADGLAAAEEGSKAKERAQTQVEEELKAARSQAAEIINKAEKRASEIVEEAKSDGREEGERMITLAQAEMEQQLHQAREQLRGEVVTLALAGASQVLEREVDAKAHSASLDKLAAEL